LISYRFNFKEYEKFRWHFHWGFNNYQGSEHLIDYVKYPLELHFVHQASDKTLAVVGFLFQLSDTDNLDLTTLMNAVAYDSTKYSIYRLLLINLLF